jgi:hypothetical protein
MEKEFHVIEVGFIGSFLEERADNDGDTLRKNISLDVQNNNIYVINPVTGLLESKIGDANDDTPEFIQFNSEKIGSPTANLIIKNVGRTIKVVNTTNTEICVNNTISGSNYKYSSGPLPSGAESCLKSIYFTSNKNIHWPKLEQTYAFLDDLSKKIPYDEGFSKKYYKMQPILEEHLKMIEKETKISSEFLKKLHTLFLFDSEYPDNIENSKIKLSPEWDGFSVDKNDANNLVYSDYFKTGSAEYANFVFLVTDRTLDDLHHYFLSSSFKDNYFNQTNTYNPEIWIDDKNKRKENYGELISLKPKVSGSLVTFNTILPQEMYSATEEQVLDILYKLELYKIDPSITDLDLVEDIVATNIFMDIVNMTDLFVINKQQIGGLNSSDQTELQNIESNINIMNPLLNDYAQLISTNKMVINNKVFHLIQHYVNFQKNNNFPFRININFNKDKFGTLFNGDPFYITDENGLLLNSIRLSRTIELSEDISTGYITVTTASVSLPPINENDVPLNMLASLDSFIIQRTTPPILKDLNYDTDYVESNIRFITKQIFENGLDRNNKFYTSSAPITHRNYYIPIYTNNPENPLSKYIFDIAYAHISGSGSSYLQTYGDYQTEYLPAKTLYKKYVAEIFGNQEYMIFKNNVRSDYFYILQFNRDAFKTKLDSQNLQISLSPIISNINQLINTGSNFYADENSNTIYTLIDDSITMKYFSFPLGDSDEYYNLVEGTQQDGLKYEENESESWGMVFPNRGLILLDGQVLDKYCNFNTVTASIDGDNIKKLFLSISSSCSPNLSRQNHEYWYVRSAERYSDDNYFCRVGRNEFNYSNNYTYVSGSTRKFLDDKLNNSTKTYVTTIGLYGIDQSTGENALLAVAKLSKPFLKDSSEEYVFNIKLKSI